MVHVKRFGGLALATALVLVTNNADARHHHHSHGSYGSCGSSGGSYGSWGSHGSSGGSYGSSGSSGSSGSYGSYGSSGSSGAYGGAPATASYSSDIAAPTAVAAEPTDRAHLTLNVPGDAVVYLSNQRMTLEGTSRDYVVPGLRAGLQYRYPVRVEVVRDGRLYSASANQEIQAGQQVNLVFNQSEGRPQIVALRD